MIKNYIMLTDKNREVVVRAESIEEAKFVLKRYTKETIQSIRKLNLLDLIQTTENILVLPNNEYIWDYSFFVRV